MRVATRAFLLAFLALPLATALALGQPGAHAPKLPLTLVSASPQQLAAGLAQTVDFTYRGSLATVGGDQVLVEWSLFEGSTLKSRTIEVAPLAASGVANGWRASVALDLASFPTVTSVSYRAQAVALSFHGNAAHLAALSRVDRGTLAATSALAQVTNVTASEFAGGFGIMPAITPPPPPPPPTITFSATLANTSASDLAANDPTLALEVVFQEITPTGLGAPQTALAPLGQTIVAGSSADEMVQATLAHTLDKVHATVTLVRIDPATGKVVGRLSPAFATDLAPPIAYPV